MRTGLLIVGLMVVLMLDSLSLVQAQGRPETLGSFRAWDALVSKDRQGRKTCYMVSSPRRSQASRKGARRGDIYMTVTHRPGVGVTGEVNIVVGYPLKTGSEVRINVDGKSRFNLFTEGSGAWAYDPRDDGQIVTAMKRGNNLVARGTSARGTNTTDTFSLSGFTAAYNAITKACR